MNPIPITWCVAGALATTAVGFGAGWQVNQWRWEAKEAAALKKGAKKGDQLQARVETKAGEYEGERTNVTDRSPQIRTVYRDRIVSADCEPPPAVGRMLDDAIADANARASGEPRQSMPADPAATDPVPRP